MASRRRVDGAIRFLVNARDLQLEFARVLHETLPVPILMYGSEIKSWKEKERFRVRVVQMDNLRGLLSIRRLDRVLNVRIKELCGVRKGLDERIDESVLRWSCNVERMERDRIAKRFYVGEFAGSRSVGRPRKRWIDTVKECLKKRGLYIRQAKRMVQDRSEWWRFVKGNAWGVARGMNH